MGQLVVIAPTDVADGFALGGARVAAVDAETTAAEPIAQTVEAAMAAGAAVVAVHHTLWATVAAPTRRRWEQQLDCLVLALPADDGEPAVDRAAELHSLLAHAVGYEISFTANGDQS